MPEDSATQTQVLGPRPAEPREATLRDAGILLAKFLGAMVVLALPLGIWQAAAANTAHLRTILFLQRTINAVAIPCAILCLLVTTRHIGKPSLVTGKELRSPRALLAVLFGFALCAATAIANLANSPGARMIAPRHWLSLLVDGAPFHLTWAELILSTVGTCVLTPIAEEWMYRGFIQPALVRWWGPVAGIAIVALGFTLIHRWSVINLVATGAFAVALGLIAHRRQSLTYCILIHAAYNLTALAPGIWRSLQYLT
jgi:membrane protease YdiL (CAAX protease family)